MSVSSVDDSCVSVAVWVTKTDWQDFTVVNQELWCVDGKSDRLSLGRRVCAE